MFFLRWCCVWLGVVGLLQGVGVAEDSGRGEIVLIEAGASRGLVLVADSAATHDRFAAEQVQSYLKKMTGVSLPIVSSDTVPEGPVILVGSHPGSSEVAETLASHHPDNPEAFAIVSRGDRLHLLGQSHTATAWAAWGWLERLGVRWLLPTERGEHVPALARVSLDAIESYEAPGMRFRGPAYWMPESDGFPAFASAKESGYDTGILYSLRRRANWNVGLTAGEGITGVGGGHSYMYYLPADRYHADHPEWFNLVGGKRQGPDVYWWQICFTNESAAAEFAKNMLLDIEHRFSLGYTPQQIKAFVSPNDYVAWCECDPCQKLVDTDGNASSMVFHFANLVAKHVHVTYPEIPIYAYAYWNHTTPVTRIELGPNVIPELTMWTAAESVRANHAHPMFSEQNARYRDYFQRWSDLADGISAYAYYGHYNWFIPYPQTRQMAHDIPQMASNPKFVGMYSESHMHWSTQAPNFYLHHALMWDPGADAKAVLADFYRAGFGPAAEAIREYYTILEQQMAEQGYIVGMNEEVSHFLTPEIIRQCRARIEEARGYLSEMDENMRWRTELVIEGWENSEKFARAVALVLNPQSPQDRLTALALIEEIEAYMTTDQGRFAFEVRMARPQLANMKQSLPLALDALPAGRHAWSGGASNGGVLNFWATVRGMHRGLWGYFLPSSGRGTLALPLRAEPGRKITAARVRIDAPAGGVVTLRVTLVGGGDDAAPVTLAVQPNTPFDVPADSLGGNTLDLAIEVICHYHDPLTSLYSVNLDLMVE